MKEYIIGIDLGGMSAKGAIFSLTGELLAEQRVKTCAKDCFDTTVENLAGLAKSLAESVGATLEAVAAIGMGAPGVVDSARGIVLRWSNFGWIDAPLAQELSKKTGVLVCVANDANVAALGEAKFGAAKGCDNMVMITLGTGVGAGIVAEGILLEGNKSAGAELGHSVIVVDGEQCSCGRKGCFEAYSSATALIRDTKRAMEAHKDSDMWEIGSLDEVTGKTAFDYKDADPYAKEVVDNYLKHLACGIVNVANIFRPEIVLLGGGVCAQGSALTKPLQKLLDKEIFAGELGPKVKIRIAELGNSAGLLGAAALLM